MDKEIKSMLNEEIPACYHLAQNLLSSLLHKNLKFKMYRSKICLLFIWVWNAGEEHRLRMFKN